tara:strand:+ start:196 stop:651 length:456 start_codon:yes stop_codon:yes gene_type:complete
MMKKIVFFLFLSFLLQNCDYTPIYSKNSSYDFYIEKITQEGNSEINTLIRNKLKKYQNKEKKKKFTITNISNLQKISQSKNKSGNTDQYLLSLEVKFLIKSENDEKNFIVLEKFKMKNFDNEFDEKIYERTIKNNITELVVKELIIQLSRM